jgi:hypothetical protein
MIIDVVIGLLVAALAGFELTRVKAQVATSH